MNIPAEHPSSRMVTESVLARTMWKPGSPERARIRRARMFFPGFGFVRSDRVGPHCFGVGSTRSGKTLLMQMLIRILVSDRADSGRLMHRALIGDLKNEWFRTLRAFGISTKQLIVLNPFDSRCAAVDLWRDCISRADATALVKEFILATKNEQQSGSETAAHFKRVASDVLTAVVFALQRRGEFWDLASIIRACRTPDTLQSILKEQPEGRDAIASYFKRNNDHTDSVFGTVSGFVSEIAPIAFELARAKTRVSLKHWASPNGSGVLILGSHPAHRSLLEAYGSFVADRCFKLLLSRFEDDPLDRSHVFVDELRSFGSQLDSLPHLLGVGASKGVRCFLATQAKEGLDLIYDSPTAAEELMALCDAKMVLRCNGPTGARFAASLFGETERYYSRENQGEGEQFGGARVGQQQSTNWGYSVDLERVPNVTPTHLDLPLASPQTGIFGFSKLAQIFAPFHLEPRFVDAYARGPYLTGPEDAGFLPWGDEAPRDTDEFERPELNSGVVMK